MGHISACSVSYTNLNNICVCVDQFVRSNIYQLLQFFLYTGETFEAVVMHVRHGRDGLFQVFLWVFFVCNVYIY